MELFLFLNQAELVATDDEVEAFALGVAKGEIDRPASAEFLRRRVMRFKWDRDQIERWLTRMPVEEFTTIWDILTSEEYPEMMRPVRIASALAQERATAASGDTAQATDA